MNLTTTAPPIKENEFFWVERSKLMSVFLGPYSSLEEAIVGAKNWCFSGGLMTPEHTEIFLTVSRKRNNILMWDLVKPIRTLGHLFF